MWRQRALGIGIIIITLIIILTQATKEQSITYTYDSSGYYAQDTIFQNPTPLLSEITEQFNPKIYWDPNLLIDNVITLNQKISGTYNALNNESGYIIEASVDPKSDSFVGTYVTVKGLKPETKYHVKVEADWIYDQISPSENRAQQYIKIGTTNITPVTTSDAGMTVTNTDTGTGSLGNEQFAVVGLNENYDQNPTETLYYENDITTTPSGEFYVVIGVQSTNQPLISYGIKQIRITLEEV